jgi:hypothetical protein
MRVFCAVYNTRPDSMGSVLTTKANKVLINMEAGPSVGHSPPPSTWSAHPYLFMYLKTSYKQCETEIYIASANPSSHITSTSFR